MDKEVSEKGPEVRNEETKITKRSRFRGGEGGERREEGKREKRSVAGEKLIGECRGSGGGGRRVRGRGRNG